MALTLSSRREQLNPATAAEFLVIYGFFTHWANVFYHMYFGESALLHSVSRSLRPRHLHFWDAGLIVSMHVHNMLLTPGTGIDYGEWSAYHIFGQGVLVCPLK